jgi:hypothetical protein
MSSYGLKAPNIKQLNTNPTLRRSKNTSFKTHIKDIIKREQHPYQREHQNGQ